MFQLQLAAYKATELAAAGKMTTKTLHTELVYCLAGTAHVRWWLQSWLGSSRAYAACNCSGVLDPAHRRHTLVHMLSFAARSTTLSCCDRPTHCCCRRRLESR